MRSEMSKEVMEVQKVWYVAQEVMGGPGALKGLIGLGGPEGLGLDGQGLEGCSDLSSDVTYNTLQSTFC